MMWEQASPNTWYTDDEAFCVRRVGHGGRKIVAEKLGPDGRPVLVKMDFQSVAEAKAWCLDEADRQTEEGK